MLITEETKSDKSIRRGTQIATSAHHGDVRVVYMSRDVIDVADATKHGAATPFCGIHAHADLVTTVE